MPSRPLRLNHEAAATLRENLDAAAASAGLPGPFPPAALAEALTAAAAYAPPQQDRTDLPLVTIDPEGSTDLDQALWITQEERGLRVFYAIADVPGLVALGGDLDAETRRRGETAYLPHRRIPLHPERISEDAGSLLAGQDRGAYVWEILVADDGSAELVSLTRARVRSREQLSYPEAQRRLESGDPLMLALHRVGELRRQDEARRGGADLRLPEQEVDLDGSGSLTLSTRSSLPIEEDNAQISLLTGICAAELMLNGGVGLLRTMPEPDPDALRRFRAVTSGLGAPWGQDLRYGDYLRTLDPTDPQHLAILHAAASLFRGADYTPFDGAPPERREQAAVAAPYAHTTAPLRRLVDRFVLIIAHALRSGEQPPQAVRDALPELPQAMRAAGSAVGAAERACIDIVEAALLADRVGQEFDAIVVDGRLPDAADEAEAVPDGDGSGTQPAVPDGGGRDGERTPARQPRGAETVKVQLVDPPVQARATGRADSGTRVRVVLDAVDVAKGTLTLSLRL